jgi:hypothetical protein
LPNRTRDGFGGNVRVRGDPAEARAQRAEVERPVIAVAGRGASEEGEIAIAAGIDECLGRERVLPE